MRSGSAALHQTLFLSGYFNPYNMFTNASVPNQECMWLCICV
jgi:hypothetical protein